MNSNWAWLSIAFFGLAIGMYLLENLSFAICFGVLGIVSLLFYPSYQKKHYINHYKKYINDQYNKDIAIRKIDIFTDHLKIANSYSETNLTFAGLTHISETGKHIFINIKGGNAIIVPKTTHGFDALKNELIDICNKQGLKYITELNWKW